MNKSDPQEEQEIAQYLTLRTERNVTQGFP